MISDEITKLQENENICKFMKFYYHFFVGENWSISELFLTYGNYKCNVLYLNLSGLVKVQGVPKEMSQQRLC